MGTRNLTVVQFEGKIKVAQYGQWDGYPEGQGTTILKFLQNNDLTVFKQQLKKVKFIPAKEITKRWKKFGADDSGFVGMDIADKFRKVYPQLDRDCAAEVLQLIQDGKATELNNQIKFAGDSLFCEWAYVIDMDKNTFEVYEGFNKTPLEETERFYKYFNQPEHRKDDVYYPVKLAKTYELHKLPTTPKFIKDFENVEEES